MKSALIWGINQYPGIPGSDLAGCVNDALDMANTLAAKGFSCTVRTDSQATKSRIITDLNGLVAGCHAGDVLVVAGSSHGSYVADQSGDEVDRKDELICTYDYPSGYILDDEFRAILGRLPAGVICEVFLDCCYSGTATRIAPQQHKIPVIGSRFAPPIVRKKKAAKAVIVPTMKENLWAACGENQTSAECLVGGVARGISTYYVCKFLREQSAWTRNQIVENEKTKIRAIGLNQVPQLECKAAAATRKPFT